MSIGAPFLLYLTRPPTGMNFTLLPLFLTAHLAITSLLTPTADLQSKGPGLESVFPVWRRRIYTELYQVYFGCAWLFKMIHSK